jgi:putative salt-induced outer membrane protein YdiY
MLRNLLSRLLIVLAWAAASSVQIRADVIETKDGAKIVGRVTKIDGGSVYVDTTYAGSLIIRQTEVVGIQIASPAGVRLGGNTPGSASVGGAISTQNGVVRIADPHGTVTTTVGKIAALWPAEGKDPEAAARELHWKYEADFDLDGENGNQNQLGTAAGFRATLANSVDDLQLYTNYNRQVTNGVASADQFKVGIDYASNFEPTESWYVRNEAGFDRIMGVSRYDIAAAGLGYDLVKNKKETLTARVGLAYRYDDYTNLATPIVNSAGADLEINHSFLIGDSKLTNRLAIDPAFENLNNFVLEHESAYEIPLVAPGWKLRLGVANDYDSRPSPGIQKLDTTYFTRLILSL